MLKGLEDYWSEHELNRLDRVVMECLSYAYALSADVIVVENPVSLERGRAWKVRPSSECCRYLEGSRITIAEVKTSSRTTHLKSGIGQLMMYSKIIGMETALHFKREIPISTELVIPVEEGKNLNPLIEDVCELLDVKIVPV